MSVLFDPSGILNVAADPSNLPESATEDGIASDALTRCKNLRLNQKGQAKTRDGSAKLNATAIDTPVWWIEEQNGVRYSFAGGAIYGNESSFSSGLTEAQWGAVKYNAFNDSAQNIFATNGTDKKRIESFVVSEWGIAAPTEAPTLSVGQGVGLTGRYNARYTYIRKVNGATVAESNPSPPADQWFTLANQSLAVEVAPPTDLQVTHIRLYRTEQNGIIYYRDQDIPFDFYQYGVSHSWEGGYLAGNPYQFSTSDDIHSTDDAFTWERTFENTQDVDTGGYGGDEWWNESEELYQLYLQYLRDLNGGF